MGHTMARAVGHPVRYATRRMLPWIALWDSTRCSPWYTPWRSSWDTSWVIMCNMRWHMPRPMDYSTACTDGVSHRQYFGLNSRMGYPSPRVMVHSMSPVTVFAIEHPMLSVPYRKHHGTCRRAIHGMSHGTQYSISPVVVVHDAWASMRFNHGVVWVSC